MKRIFIILIVLLFAMPAWGVVVDRGDRVITGNLYVGGALHSATADSGGVTTLNTLYVDGNKTGTYDADGGISRPYKTVLAALTAINADVGKSWIVKVAPGTYSDNLTITGPRSLRIEGAGVTLSGTILINSGVGSYDRIEFVGVEGGRAEKGPAMTVSGKITATRTNDSLIYVGFHGCLISGEFEATTNGTWVLQYSNCRVNGAITGTFAENTQLDASILIGAYGFNEFVGTVSGIVSFYNCNGADIYATINTTPWFENRFTHSSFAGAVSIIPQVGASSALIYVDALSIKSLIARTPTITGATYSQLEYVGTETYPGVLSLATNAETVTGTNTTKAVTPADITAHLAAPKPIGNTTPNSGAFTTLSATSTVSGQGFTDYMASPPAIGGTAAAAGTFTTLTGSTVVIPEKTPVNAVASSKLLTIGTVPVEGATVSIGGVAYKFREAIGAGAAATATLTSDETEVVDGDTVTVNDITYRFKDTMEAANDVKRDGTTADTTLANLVAAINLSGTEGVEYYAGTSAATGVVAAAVSSHATVITADDIGFAGNSLAKVENSIHLDFDGEGAYFTGGVDAQAANDVLIGTVEESIDNLVLAVTYDAGAGTNEGVKYGTGTVVNPLATAVKASASTMTATNLIKGVIGDSTAIAETLADGSWASDATFLSGGVNATTCMANEIVADGSFLYHCIATGTIADTNWRKIDLGSAY
jgi:hypothetical protein